MIFKCDLTQLLDEHELHHLMYAFEQIDRDGDGYIVLEEFLSLQSNKRDLNGLEFFTESNSIFGKTIFSLMDSSKRGVIAWSDFALFYTCKLVATKDKVKLVIYVSYCFKYFFKD